MIVHGLLTYIAYLRSRFVEKTRTIYGVHAGPIAQLVRAADS